MPEDTPLAPATVEVAPTANAAVIKGQLRIWVTFAAGILASKYANFVPVGAVNDQLVGLIVAGIVAGSMSAWQWVRSVLTHTKLFTIASNPNVPDAVAVVVPGKVG